MQIEITENTGNALTDYQVLINLNTGNFNYSHVIDANGNDIRFDCDDTECSYWIETWNTSDDSKIWVRIPNLDSNQTKMLYMFYGYISALQMSNGDDTYGSSLDCCYSF